MFIIHTDAEGKIRGYQIVRTAYANGKLVVEVQETETDLIRTPSTYPIPLSVLSPDIEIDVAEWLVSVDGPFAGGNLVTDDAFELETARAALKKEIKQRRDKADFGGLTNAHGSFDTDPDSQRKISGAVTMALILDTQFVMEWRRSDNTVVTLDKAGMIDVGLSIGMHSATCQANKNALDTLVDAAITVADLEAVDVESGWPG